MTCCDEHRCRRSQPIEVRRGHFSGQWTAITRYRRHDSGVIEAQEKHVLSPASQAEIELCGSVLRDLHAAVREWHEEAKDAGEVGEGAYARVLDKLAELAEAKETALIGPRPEPGDELSASAPTPPAGLGVDTDDTRSKG